MLKDSDTVTEHTGQSFSLTCLRSFSVSGGEGEPSAGATHPPKLWPRVQQ